MSDERRAKPLWRYVAPRRRWSRSIHRDRAPELVNSNQRIPLSTSLCRPSTACRYKSRRRSVSFSLKSFDDMEMVVNQHGVR